MKRLTEDELRALAWEVKKNPAFSNLDVEVFCKIIKDFSEFFEKGEDLDGYANKEDCYSGCYYYTDSCFRTDCKR